MTFDEWFEKEYPIYARGGRDESQKQAMRKAFEAGVRAAYEAGVRAIDQIEAAAVAADNTELSASEARHGEEWKCGEELLYWNHRKGIWEPSKPEPLSQEVAAMAHFELCPDCFSAVCKAGCPSRIF